MQVLRVIDGGDVGAVRSQSLWHGIASAMTAESTPTLSFCHPVQPYVCLGYHRSAHEVNGALCRQLGLQILRRQIGGGAVFIDANQIFFQLTLPANRAPARVDHLYREYLTPAVSAFRAMGVPARLHGLNEISVEDRRVSGTGAGRIGEAVTVVGNVIFSFPHEQMAGILALPTPAMRRECLLLMRRHVSSIERDGRRKITLDEVRTALVEAYARALGLEATTDELTRQEELAIGDWESRLRDAAWLEDSTAWSEDTRQVKISGGVWVSFARRGDLGVQVTVVDGKLGRVRIDSSTWNGTGSCIGRALSGQPANESAVARCLEPFGEPGQRVKELVLPGLRLR